MSGTPATRAVILSGGVAHDFPALSSRLAGVLGEAGLAAAVRTDVEQALLDVASAGHGRLLVVNLLRWRMLEGRYAAQREQWGLSLSGKARRALAGWVRGGGAMLAMHSSAICFDDWPEWKDLAGARWEWGVSSHPPVGPAVVRAHPQRHPIVAGLPESFVTDDEIYGFLDLAADVEPLLTAEHGGASHPLLWAREVGAGRVAHTTLGHHLPSYEPPEFRRIVRRAALWALRAPAEAIASA